MSLKVTGIYGNKLYYKVIFDDYYIITSGTFNVLQNGNYVASGSISTLGSVDEFVGSIDISNCDFSTGDSIVLSLYSISINKNTGFNPELSYQFVY
jgi:hypothetical protein